MENILPAVQTSNKLFLTGPFGSGKSTLGIDRIRWLLGQERVRGSDILVLVPQIPQAEQYRHALRRPDTAAGPLVRVTTVAGLARTSVELYWPLLASVTGFVDANREPTFLNLETSQYHMAHLIDTAIDQGEFDSVRVERNRIISQVLDNLNKAALHGFSIDEAYARLELAVPPGDQRTGQLNALRAAQRVSHAFRELCLQRSLVDFSLQMEIFGRQLLTNQWSRTHLFRSYHHLIVDNAEENNATAHDLVRQWLPELESAVVIVDQDGGYRLFLGADPDGAAQLAESCDQVHMTSPPETQPASLHAAVRQIDRALAPTANGYKARAPQTDDDHAASAPAAPERSSEETTQAASTPLLREALRLPDRMFRFYPQMLQWVADQVADLVHEQGVEAGDIAIVAPYVSDALRFNLQTELSARDVPSTTHRPSRALQDEPTVRCLLTLAALAHPDWNIRPSQSDVRLALLQSIDRLDPVRAGLLSNIVYPQRRSTIELTRFAALEPGIQARISYAVGEAYDRLHAWIYAYRTSAEVLPLDQFFARLFGEILSQPGFGFHAAYDAARVANQLVDSARNFRWSLENHPGLEESYNPLYLGRDYVNLIHEGALGALYVPGWREPADAVFIAPAYTFLMRNRTVDIQFWLDIGSTGWWERLYQPLTHPYVLSRSWPPDAPWTDLDEYRTRQATMRRLLLGLLRRTRRQVYLGISDYGESGFEERGALLNLINQLLAQPG